MTQARKVIDNSALNPDRPTELSFGQLYRWVIWQFPRRHSGGLSGAVKPPDSAYGWFPAVILTRQRRVLVHAHVKKNFATPEEALDWLLREER